MRVPNIHFEPESRQLQSARLEHLLSFSDLVVLLIGEQGLGKSHLLNQLRPQQQPMQPSWVHLTPDTAFDVTHLLQALDAHLGISCEPNNRARLTALHAYARELADQDERLHICVDDADYLSDNALELLINFSKVDSAAPRVLLAGLPEFEQRFFEREFNRLVEGSLHVEHLQSYSAEESRGFVDAHLLDGRQLKDAQYRRLLVESQGRPDLLKAALAKLLDGSGEKGSGMSSIGNRWYWLGIALVLATTAGAIGYLYTSNDQGEAEITRPLEIPIPQVVQTDPASDAELIAARAELAKRLEAQEKRLAQVESDPVQSVAAPAIEPAQPPEPTSAPALEPEPLEPEAEPIAVAEVTPSTDLEPEPVRVEVAETSALAESIEAVKQLPPGAELNVAAVDDESNSEPVTVAPQPAVVAAEPAQTEAAPAPAPAPESAESEPAKFSRDIETLLGWPATDLTIQLLAAREEKSADTLIERYGASVSLLKLSYPYKGAQRYTIVTGHYPSRAAANAAVSKLPRALQNLKPWIRSVTGLKTELNTALNP